MNRSLILIPYNSAEQHLIYLILLEETNITIINNIVSYKCFPRVVYG